MTKESLHINIIGQNEPIVMLHGWGVNAAVFQPLHDAFKNHRVYYVDLPGFGDSAPVAGDIDSWVDYIMARVPERAIWAGWSLGGLLATRAALRYPERVQALLTIASSPCFTARVKDNWSGIAVQVLEQFSHRLDKDPDGTITRFLALQALGSATAKQNIRQLKNLMMATPSAKLQALKQGLEMLADVDLRASVCQLEQPWLRVWGRLDSLVPYQVQTLLPSGQKISDQVLTESSHMPFLSQKEVFIDKVTDWLNGL